ncbi:MMPL family transporter [Rhodopila sp.]|uniref:MMPL family transporter n=1 Tax=Rhodopila sp. TaxID=2480087 RepID=UPI003D1111A8
MVLGYLAAACARRAGLVALLALLLAAAGLFIIHTRLGVTTDTNGLFSKTLPWKQRQAELQAAFPQGEDLLVAVIDAKIPEQADSTAAHLADALRQDTTHFSLVRRPDASPYLQRNALLFLDPGPLTDLLNQTIDAQPFLGYLAQDPSLRGLARALSLIAEAARRGQASLTPFEPALAAFHKTLAATNPTPLSWQNLMAGPVSSLAGRYRFVLAKPRPNYGALQPGAAATQAIRDAAAKLPFVRDGAARVRITGSVALDDDEFATVAQGAAVGLLGSLLLVTLWLFIAVRSWRLILPIVLTLLLGLDLTAAFAALAVGTLNLVSVAFAVLFVGLAVDFAIQFTVRFREASLHTPAAVAALGHTGRHSGSQILVAALATAAGFLAFTPTSFAGVAQLGLIAGVGMLLAFICTLAVLPALIALFRPAAEAGEVGFVWARPIDTALARHRRPVLAAAALLTLLGLGLLPWLRFDSDPLHTKNQNTESVQTLNDLIADPVTSPYSIEILKPSLAAAEALAPKLRALPTVDGVLSLNSLVPDDQTRKRQLIADAADILMTTLNVPPEPHPDAAALRAAIRDALPAITAAAAKPAGRALKPIADDLRNLGNAPDQRLTDEDAALTRFLPQQLKQLLTALQATATVTQADIPPDLARDWITPDGRAKLQVMPKPQIARTSAGLHRFVAEVAAVVPSAGGAAVTIVRSAETIVAAFRFAAIGALIAITIILAVALRRLLDTALVLASLLLSSLLTVIVAVALPLPLNFANIIALPLLLGVGVSFNVYFVMNWRAGRTAPLASATARAILFSALTTSTAFGSLALSRHPGTASMGDLLLVSLACTLLATFVFLPALLASCRRG